MNTELFIAKRVGSKDKEKFSGPVVLIAVTAVALGLAVMIISIAVLSGFRYQIRSKVEGFAADIRIDKFDANFSYESSPVSIHQDFYPEMGNVEGIRHIQVFAMKAGIIKTEEQMQGIVLKGIWKDYDWDFIRKNLVSGKTFTLPDSGVSDEVIISAYQSRKLKLGVGDDLRVYFISEGQNQPRGRKFSVAGIYQTGLEELDKVYVLGDIRHVQRLNQWDDDQVSGFELFVNDFDHLDEVGKQVYYEIGYSLNAETVKQAYPQIFDWLKLMDMNVAIILVMMILVSSITMISTLLIIILDRTPMIGVLKALGMTNRGIRQVFLYNASGIILRGMVWGNVAAFLLLFMQLYFKIIPLDPASYYMDHVPVRMEPGPILLINIGTFLVCLIALLLPSIVVTRISPVRAIRVN